MDVVVVGAGQAGLATAHELLRRGVVGPGRLAVLDASPRPGGAWQHTWRSLLLGTTNRLSDLPGLPLTEEDTGRPVADVVPEYFERYEHLLGLSVRRPVRARGVSRTEDRSRLLVRTSSAGGGTGVLAARAVVSATGTWGRPFWPALPGRASFGGRQLHTADYRGSAEMTGRRVAVVGAGISAVQLLLEVAEVAAATLWVTRRPPQWRSTPFDAEAGRAVEKAVAADVAAGRPLQSLSSRTGLPVTDAVRAGIASGVLAAHPMPDRLVPAGLEWDAGRGPGGASTWPADVVLWCTGFRPDVAHLAPLHLREPAGGLRLDGTRAVREPRLHLVGYGPSASTIGAPRAARSAARGVVALLREEGVELPGTARAPGALLRGPSP